MHNRRVGRDIFTVEVRDSNLPFSVHTMAGPDIFSGQRIHLHLHGGLRVAVTDLNVIWIVASTVIEVLIELLTELATEVQIVSILVAMLRVVVLLLVNVLHAAEMLLLPAETREMEDVAEATAGLLYVVLPGGAVTGTGTGVVVQRSVTGEEIAIAMTEMTEMTETKEMI